MRDNLLRKDFCFMLIHGNVYLLRLNHPGGRDGNRESEISDFPCRNTKQVVGLLR